MPINVTPSQDPSRPPDAEIDDDPFATFAEWDDRVDAEAYKDL